MQWFILFLIFIFWIIGKSAEGISNINSANKSRLALEKERLEKYGERKIDLSKNIFDRNKDIIEKFKENISNDSHEYYYIDNRTRDCINEICIAEEKYSIRPGYEYLSNWKNKAPEEWRDLSSQIKEIFLDQQEKVQADERRQKEAKQEQMVTYLSDKYADIIDQFNEIAYRKVTTIDDYGEENWNAVHKETKMLVEKIARKEGESDRKLKEWKKYSWGMPEEYRKLEDFISEKFESYYKIRKGKPIESGNTGNMSGIDFENHIAQLLKLNGFDKVSGTPKTGDQGADLIAKRGGKTIVIQAKRYQNSVGNKAVQEVVGAINFYNGDEGWVITNSSFTKSARELARKNRVKLIDGTALEQFSDVLSKL